MARTLSAIYLDPERLERQIEHLDQDMKPADLLDVSRSIRFRARGSNKLIAVDAPIRDYLVTLIAQRTRRCG